MKTKFHPLAIILILWTIAITSVFYFLFPRESSTAEAKKKTTSEELKVSPLVDLHASGVNLSTSLRVTANVTLNLTNLSVNATIVESPHLTSNALGFLEPNSLKLFLASDSAYYELSIVPPVTHNKFFNSTFNSSLEHLL